MVKLILNIHIFSVSLYLILYGIKSVLFLSGNKDYPNFRKKTIALEMIASVVFLVTGIWNIIQMGGFSAFGGWLHTKLTLVVLAIPIGLIGFKKENKLLVGLSLLFFVIVYVIAWMHKYGMF